MSEPKLKIVVLGESGIGKSSLLEQYVKKEFYSLRDHTLGPDVLKKGVSIDDTDVKLEIWDTGGQEKFRAVNAQLYRGAHCCVLVYDVTSMDSFKAKSFWKDEVIGHLNDHKFPFILIGNKIDLNKRQVDPSEAQEWGEQLNIPVFKCSAQNGDGVERAFEAAAELALEKCKRSKPQRRDTVILSRPQNIEKKEKGCCLGN